MNRERHGYCGTRTYRIWKAMRNRCNNPQGPAYHRYGGRGLHVCAARNMRVNRMIDHKGETLCLAAWAERLGTTSDVLWKRLKRKGSIE